MFTRAHMRHAAVGAATTALLLASTALPALAAGGPAPSPFDSFDSMPFGSFNGMPFGSSNGTSELTPQATAVAPASATNASGPSGSFNSMPFGSFHSIPEVTVEATTVAHASAKGAVAVRSDSFSSMPFGSFNSIPEVTAEATTVARASAKGAVAVRPDSFSSMPFGSFNSIPALSIDAAAVAPVPALAAAPVIAGTNLKQYALNNGQLADIRGGFSYGNTQFSFGFRQDTSVNGILVQSIVVPQTKITDGTSTIPFTITGGQVFIGSGPASSGGTLHVPTSSPVTIRTTTNTGQSFQTVLGNGVFSGITNQASNQLIQQTTTMNIDVSGLAATIAQQIAATNAAKLIAGAFRVP